MVIRVAAGTADLIFDYADGFAVEVTGASDVDAATAALALAKADIEALAAGTPAAEPAVVSNPVLGPGGPLLRVARLGAPDDVLATIPDLVSRRLSDLGVVEATIRSPEPGGPLDGLDTCANAVVLRLFPTPQGANGVLPATWLDVACEWALGDLAPSDPVRLRLLAVEFEVAAAEAPAVLHQAGVARAWCDVVNGRLDGRVRTASVTFGRAPHVALAAGGPGCDSAALLARFDLLVEVAREYAGQVAYACLDIEATFEGIGLGLSSGGWRSQGGAAPNLVAGSLCDVLVPDAYPYQILGPGHLARLGTDELDPDDPPIGDAVADDRVEVALGDPADWLPRYDVRADAVADALDVLAPLLATDEEVAALLEGGTTQPAAAVTGALPDLADIVLETTPHGRRGLHLTILELAAWLAHEPHSDAPASVSPVLSTYARWFASALEDEPRQRLRSRARALIGTAQEVPPRLATDGPPRLSPDDGRRAWLAADWLIRVQATAWLELAGLTEAAARLASIGPTSDHLDLVRAVDVLGSAIAIAGRRIDLTSSIAGAERADDAVLVDEVAWAAWEWASEASGWVAASEACAVGVPAELAYATDLQVIEGARDARRREELEASRRSIGDTAWAAALHAVADAAWSAGWTAAATAVDATAVVPLQTARDRATRAVLGRSQGEDDGAALDEAETLAKECLTRAALGARAWASAQAPWDAALEAAAAGPQGAVWTEVLDLTRAAVDDAAWQVAMTAARAAVDEVLQDAPDLVARSVGAAIAREASGAAARGVALRAAAVARAQGADEDATRAAARQALAPTVTHLQGAAFALLDVLSSGGPPPPT